MSLRVFAINESEWWIGNCTAQEILAAFMRANHCTHIEATGSLDVLPRELSVDELKKHYYMEDAIFDSQIAPVTFQTRLEQCAVRGIKGPARFASLRW